MTSSPCAPGCPPPGGPGWLPGLRQVASPNESPRPPGAVVDLLIIHSISLPPGQFGGADHIDALFQNRLRAEDHPYFSRISHLQVSSHLLIDRRGQPTQYVSLDRRAWHAGASSFCGRDNCNDFSIGIELEGSDDQPFTDVQYRALLAVTRDLLLRFPAINRRRIVGHCDVAPGRKTDPGPHFDWARYLSALQQSGA